jgi:hypothetical protein
MAVREEADVPDAVEPIRNGVQQEPPNESKQQAVRLHGARMAISHAICGTRVSGAGYRLRMLLSRSV